jgi:hypothetical protein
MSESALFMGGDPSPGPFTLPTEAAFHALLPEIEGVPDARARPINVDVMLAVSVVLGALPALGSLRPEIEQQLPRFDLARFDRLEQYALALSHAHVHYRGRRHSRGSIVERAAELGRLRALLRADLRALAAHGLLDARQLPARKRGRVGYKEIASDVFVLVTLFREQWPALEGKTALTMAALAEASNQALELLETVGVREQGPPPEADAARVREKAFTLLEDAYDAARSAVAYLRARQKDADSYAPPFRGGSGRRRSSRPPVGAETVVSIMERR